MFFVMRFLVLCLVCSSVHAQVADSVAVRVRVGGVCGSGSICGADLANGYVVTNAHVAGTTPGRECQVDYVSGGEKKTIHGRIIWAAYSSQRLIDVAILAVPSLTCKEYSPMTTLSPVGVPYATRGSPRCAWPLVSKDFLNPVVSLDSPLMRGDPDAIGGQSGSGVRNVTGSMVGLITWSWAGRAAAQQTSSIFEVASKRSVLDVPDRPVGLVEVQGPDPRSVTEDGIFGIASFLPADLPIWGSAPGPPAGPCVVLTPGEMKLINLIRERSGDEVAIDWAVLLKLILEIVALFRK